MNQAAFRAYLAAKRALDDRSLNPRVMRAFLDILEEHKRASRPAGLPFRIIEAGAGIGSMAERLAALGALDNTNYILLDTERATLDEARRRLHGGKPIRYRFVAEGILEYASRVVAEKSPQANAFIAQALLDLLPLPDALPLLRATALPGSPFWLNLVFDGLTVWEPTIDHELDELIVTEYHASMDERSGTEIPGGGRSAGGSRSGRRLLSLLPERGFSLIEAGASDWVVFPSGGSYGPGETFFLERILDFFEESLSGRPSVPASALRRWLDERRKQVRGGRAVFIAHNLDALAESLPD